MNPGVPPSSVFVGRKADVVAEHVKCVVDRDLISSIHAQFLDGMKIGQIQEMLCVIGIIAGYERLRLDT